MPNNLLSANAAKIAKHFAICRFWRRQQLHTGNLQLAMLHFELKIMLEFS